MLFIYIFTELLFLILIVVSKFNIRDSFILDVFQFVPIMLNLIFILNRKADVKLKTGLLVTVIADFCFFFLDNGALGISHFILVQVIYYLYLNKSQNKLLIFLALINILLVLLFQQKLLIIEPIIYFLFILINIIKSCKLSITNSQIKFIKYSLILLLFCDLCIGIKYIFNSNNTLNLIFNILEWLFYIPSQMILVIYAVNSNELSILTLKKIFSSKKTLNKN